MDTTQATRQWRFFLFYLLVLSRRARYILWKIHIPWTLVQWYRVTAAGYGGCFPWLCTSVGSDKILGGDCDYQFIFSLSVLWRGASHVVVRGFCCR